MQAFLKTSDEDSIKDKVILKNGIFDFFFIIESDEDFDLAFEVFKRQSCV